MEIIKYKCPNCNKIHEKMPLENFCKELVEACIYNFHKYKKKIRISKHLIKGESEQNGYI